MKKYIIIEFNINYKCDGKKVEEFKNIIGIVNNSNEAEDIIEKLNNNYDYHYKVISSKEYDDYDDFFNNNIFY
jgi:hypothetical protein